MWVSTSIDRARRRLARRSDEHASGLAGIAPERAACDVLLTLGSADVDALTDALVASLDPHMPRPRTPALLAGALATSIQRAGGSGTPQVTRHPAGLHSPEAWRLVIAGADGAARVTLDRLLGHDGRA
jgi:hypothetical protein